MTSYPKSSVLLRCSCAVALFAAFSVSAALAGNTGTAVPITGTQQGDGTMSAVARKAMTSGTLRLDADEALKAAANAASDKALRPAGAADAAAAAGPAGPLAPVVNQNIAGQFDAGVSPPDTTGATGTTRYIQLVNRKIGIYSRAGALVSTNSLNSLAGVTANNFDPQVIWDGTTNRFYYLMDTVVSSSDNRLGFGFSKSSSPNNASTDFCHYTISYGAKFPDFPKLGDQQLFLLFGVNNFQPSFVGSDIVAVRKPVGTGTITTCPALSFNIYPNIRDAAGQLVFTPVPSNAIDTNGFGYAISRNLSLPSTKLWIHALSTGSATTFPALQAPRTVNVASYTAPADAVQPTFTQKIDTSDARPTQAILSRNPARANVLSLWVQHTIANGAASFIRFYEIRPDVAAPIVQRTGTIGSGSTFFYNAAVSSDRRVTNAATGNNVVIGYSVSSTTLSPRIVAGSSVGGAAFQFVQVQNGAGPYRDFTCAGAGQTCRWGDYAGATPDPLPQGGAASAVGLTNQFSPGGAMPTTQSNWRTKIFNINP